MPAALPAGYESKVGIQTKGLENMAEITAQMAGMIESVLVEVGDVVVEGQHVANLESMKMLVKIETAAGGKVVQIHVEGGDFVDEGGVVITIE